MKKFIVGLFVGMALMLATGAHAEVSSLIGRTIEGQYPVVVNDEKIEQPAIVVDGVSYLPTRAIGEALNSDVSFADSTVIVKSKGGTMSMSAAAPSAQELAERAAKEIEIAKEKERLENERLMKESEIRRQAEVEEIQRLLNGDKDASQEIENRISSIEYDIRIINLQYGMDKHNLTNAKTDEARKEIEQRIDDYELKLESLEAEKAALQAQLTGAPE